MIKILKNMNRKDCWLALVCIILILGQIYFDLALPDYMSNLTVLIKTPGSEISQVWETGLSMLGCALASMALCVVCGFFTARIAAGFSYTIRENIFHKVADFGQQEMLEFSVPSLITRTTNDVTQIQMLIAMGLQILVKAPVMAVWAIIKIVGKSWQLSVITAGFVVALLGLMIILLAVMMPRFKRVQKQVDTINRIARENLTGVSVVHAFNAEKYQNAKFAEANNALTKTQLFNQRAFSILPPSLNLAMNGLALAIYWVGALLINNIALTDPAARLTMFSDVVVFSTYATYVIMSLMMIVMIFMFLPAAQVSAGRINEVLKTGNSIVAVSYTHLDVYKRQVSDRETGGIILVESCKAVCPLFCRICYDCFAGGYAICKELQRHGIRARIQCIIAIHPNLAAGNRNLFLLQCVGEVVSVYRVFIALRHDFLHRVDIVFAGFQVDLIKIGKGICPLVGGGHGLSSCFFTIAVQDYGNAFRASLSIAVNPCFGSAYRRLFLQQFVGDRQCTGNILDRHFAEGNNNRIRRSRRFVIPIGSGGLGQCIGCLLYTSRCV